LHEGEGIAEGCVVALYPGRKREHVAELRRYRRGASAGRVVVVPQADGGQYHAAHGFQLNLVYSILQAAAVGEAVHVRNVLQSGELRGVAGTAMFRRSMSPITGKKLLMNGLPAASGLPPLPVANWYGMAFGTPVWKMGLMSGQLAWVPRRLRARYQPCILGPDGIDYLVGERHAQARYLHPVASSGGVRRAADGLHGGAASRSPHPNHV
nr:hypothetical protein [Tanacetum cinerariifolium]